jgi:signal transduction histidine kinase
MNPYSIPPLLSLAALLALAVLTLARGRAFMVNRIFLWICFLGAVLQADMVLVFNIASEETALWVSRAGHMLSVFLIPTYVHFFHLYLGVTRRRRLIPVAYGYAVCLMCLAPTPLLIEGMHTYPFGYFGRGGRLYFLVGLGAGAAVVYALALLHLAMVREKSSVRKNRLKFVSAGFGIVGLLVGCNVLPGIGVAVYPPGGFAFLALAVFAYGLFNHDLLDMGLAIRRGLVYSLLTALLTGIYALTVLSAQRLLAGSALADSMVAPVLSFLLIAAVFGPLRGRIQQSMNHLFEKQHRAYQETIRTVSRTIASVLDEDRIAGLLDTVADALDTDRCALYLAHRDGSGFFLSSERCGASETPFPPTADGGSTLVQVMDRTGRPIRRDGVDRRHPESCPADLHRDMAALEATLALPLVFKQQLNGFVVLGEKRSGALFTRRDMGLLDTLANQSALAVENARAYKTIAEMNRHLEEKVRARTRELETALAEKERSQELLIRSESLAAIGQLVAGTAHELNNPLTSVKSLVQSTIEDLSRWDGSTEPEEDLVADLQFADRELSRARSIVSSLLGLSRQTQTYSEPVNLNTVVGHALRVLHNQHKGDDIRIVEDLDATLPEIRGNFANLGQVALNIIKNAVQAVKQRGGTVTLATRKTTEGARFTCTDTGPGVAETQKKDIFKPFFTTKPVGQGTGLGLYICHEIVTRHGGTIALTDADATTFEVRLPCTGPQGD